jgi:hypothetical protein
MSLVTKVMVAAVATLTAVACSSTPTQASASAAAAASPATAAPSNGADAAAVPQVNTRLVGQGYKAVKAKDAFVYCRMEAVTGTQFKKRVCLTEAAIHDLEEQTKQTQDSMNKQRTGPACFTKTC